MLVFGALDGCQNFSASSRLLRVGGQIPAATDPEARYHHNASYLAGLAREVQDVGAVTGAVHRSSVRGRLQHSCLWSAAEVLLHRGFQEGSDRGDGICCCGDQPGLQVRGVP